MTAGSRPRRRPVRAASCRRCAAAVLAGSLIGALVLGLVPTPVAADAPGGTAPAGPGRGTGAPASQGPYRLSPANRWVRAFPNVTLTTHEGRVVRFYDDLLRGRGAIVSFMYTSCVDRCPLATANLARVQALLAERLGRDLIMLSITVDPERDTPEALRRFAATHGAREGWHFLTGTRQDIEAVQRSLGVTGAPGSATERDVHTGMLVVGHEERGRWARIDIMSRPDRIADFVRRVVDRAP